MDRVLLASGSDKGIALLSQLLKEQEMCIRDSINIKQDDKGGKEE